MTSNTAPIKWAQRTDSLYITIAIPDVKDETIDLTDTELHFKGTSEGKLYEVSIKFYESIDSSNPESTYKVLPRSVQMHVIKAKKEEDDGDDETFWPRLLADKTLEKNQVKIDWDRYVDEDEEDEAGGFDTSALDGGMGMGGGMPPGMGGMGGMGGMPGMEGMDMEALMKQMGQMGGGAGGMPGMPGMGDDFGGDDGEADSDDDDEDDLPELEE
mmetsp:Transcript_6493/g.8221  ORF Transcript_6493/g.8221 Transcript_6493/m.8221 type:complete len:214 (+) Transcript_6493:125-766(+)